jgi:hypothetical protein
VQIFVAASFALSFWLVLEVAAFASTQALRVEERNMFYVAPLFLIALLVWVEQRAPRPAVVAVAAAGLADVRSDDEGADAVLGAAERALGAGASGHGLAA